VPSCRLKYQSVCFEVNSDCTKSSQQRHEDCSIHSLFRVSQEVVTVKLEMGKSKKRSMCSVGYSNLVDSHVGTAYVNCIVSRDELPFPASAGRERTDRGIALTVDDSSVTVPGAWIRQVQLVMFLLFQCMSWHSMPACEVRGVAAWRSLDPVESFPAERLSAFSPSGSVPLPQERSCGDNV
jgi:hypothetical protein